eukprot:4614416-Pyramimonas_sp.AAC.1
MEGGCFSTCCSRLSAAHNRMAFWPALELSRRNSRMHSRYRNLKNGVMTRLGTVRTQKSR